MKSGPEFPNSSPKRSSNDHDERPSLRRVHVLRDLRSSASHSDGEFGGGSTRLHRRPPQTARRLRLLHQERRRPALPGFYEFGRILRKRRLIAMVPLDFARVGSRELRIGSRIPRFLLIRSIFSPEVGFDQEVGARRNSLAPIPALHRRTFEHGKKCAQKEV